MRILVTGGKGDLGARLVPLLRADGHDVVIGSRVPQADGEAEYTLESDPGAVVEGAEVVVHLASDPVKPKKDIEAARRLIAACKAAGVGHVVFISIVGIDEHPLPYYQAKLACEEVISEGAVGWTVLRATQFHSFVPRIAELLRKGPVTFVPKGYRVQPISADAVAERLAELVARGPSGRVRDIGGPEIVSVADVIRKMPTIGGKDRRVFSIRIPGKLGSAFKDGLNLLDEKGEILGGSYSDCVGQSG